MGIFSRLLGIGSRSDNRDTQEIAATVERVLQLHPHLRLARRCQARLSPAVATSLKHVSELVDSVPAARQASAGAWATDPYIHAFFAGPDDVARVISRSTDLRTFFESNWDVPEAFAVLGMALAEREILGVGLEGETVRSDVRRTTLSFGDHQVRICGRTDVDLRSQIVARLLDQLMLEGLARIAAEKSSRDALEQERALVKTRLQLLERQGAGIRGVLGSEVAAEPGEVGQMASQLQENARNLASLGTREKALDRGLDLVCEVFAQPGQHVFLSTRRVRLDRMNVVMDADSTQVAADVEFRIARIPATPPRMRAFSLIRFGRADLLPVKSLRDEAARLLF